MLAEKFTQQVLSRSGNTVVTEGSATQKTQCIPLSYNDAKRWKADQLTQET